MAFLSPISIRLPYSPSRIVNAQCARKRPACATLTERVSAASMTETPIKVPTQSIPTPIDEPIETISSGAGLDHLLHRSTEQLVIIRVHARWCRSCRALEPKWRRLSRELANSAHFAELEFEANRILAARLDVKVMPTFVIFENGQKVDHFSCGPRRAALLRTRVELAAENRERRLNGQPLLEVPDTAVVARQAAENRN